MLVCLACVHLNWVTPAWYHLLVCLSYLCDYGSHFLGGSTPAERAIVAMLECEVKINTHLMVYIACVYLFWAFLMV